MYYVLLQVGTSGRRDHHSSRVLSHAAVDRKLKYILELVLSDERKVRSRNAISQVVIKTGKDRKSPRNFFSVLENQDIHRERPDELKI